MRRHQQRNAARGRGAGLAREVNLPLPINGLFAYSKTAEVNGQFASRLENLRSNGVSIEMTGAGVVSNVEDVAEYRIPYEFGGAPKYVRATATNVQAGTDILDRVLGPQPSFGYLSNNVIIADGQGVPIRYDGDGISVTEFMTDGSVEMQHFDGFLAHHDLPYFWVHDGTLDFYYGATIGAIQGDLVRFPLGQLGNITGNLAGMLSITMDASDDLNDNLAIMTTTGWIILYEGTDPGDEQNWRQAGKVKTSPLIDRNGYVDVAGDIWMITQAGVVSVLETLRRGQLALASQLTQAIRRTIDEWLQEGGDWQFHASADGLSIIINRVFNGKASQLIFNTQSQTWSEGSYPARRWHNLNGKTQYTTLSGTLATLGGNGLVTSTWHTGWFYLSRGTGISYLQPTVIADGPLTFNIAVLTDHDETPEDIAEATQTVTVEPDAADPNGQKLALNEIIGCDAAGSVYQLRVSMTARDAEIVALRAGIV